MSQVEQYIASVGGVTALSRILSVPHSSVVEWKKEGTIPAKHAVRIEKMTKGKFKAITLVGNRYS